jgi:hypothetical protein
MFGAASHYARTYPSVFPGGWVAKTIIGLTFAGGSLGPLVIFAPWVWRRRALAAGGLAVIGLTLALFWNWSDFGLFMNTNAELLKSWEFAAQIAFWAVAGVNLLLLAGSEAWNQDPKSEIRNPTEIRSPKSEIRKPGNQEKKNFLRVPGFLASLFPKSEVSLLLVLWILDGLLFATVLNWTINGRSMLPIVPAAAILLVRRLEAAGFLAGGAPPGRRHAWLLVPLGLSAALAWSLTLADFQMTGVFKTAALDTIKKYHAASANRQLWFEGHGTIQYYLEQGGGQPLDITRSVLQPGDLVVVPWMASPFVVLPPGSAALVESLVYLTDIRATLSSGTSEGVAGFYSALTGPVPFAFGDAPCPVQGFSIVQMATKIKWNSTPINPEEVKHGGAPSFRGFSFLDQGDTNLQARISAETAQCQPAAQAGAEGNVSELMARYRQVLTANSNNAVALNNLAWTLATTGAPGLRNGAEAVQLASRAVELTGHRLPQFLGTLAAAQAEAGDFAAAMRTAGQARQLAVVTGQLDIAASNARLMMFYAQGKTAAGE